MSAGAEVRSRLLADLAAALTAAATDLDRVVQCAAEAAAQLIGDAAVVRLVNDDGVFDRVAVHHSDPAVTKHLRELIPGLRQRADEGFAATARDAGTVVVINDLSEQQMLALAGPLRSLPDVPSLGAALIVPLIADGEFLGVISTARHGRDRPYGDAECRLASDVAARVALAVAVARSVTQLRAERESYAQIVQTCAEGVWKVDAGGRTTFANDRMAEFLAVPLSRLLDEPASAWLSEPAAEPWWRMAPGDPHELQLRQGGGQLIWAQVSVSPLPAPPGAAAAGCLALVTDITDRMRSRELDQRVAQMQRMDSIGQLAGGIAHDFNNLLSIISGAAELLQTEVPAGSSAAALAEQVSRTVEQGAALTRQLLAFGRGQAGNAETVDVSTVIADLAPMLRRTLGEHIDLRFPPPQPNQPCLVRIDQGHLHQILVNLAANARDAMNAGGRLSIDCDHMLIDRAELGDTEIAAEPDQPDKVWFVRLAVSDTGTGMDADTLQHAFEPFFTTKSAGHGTGLGLAGVYGMIRAAGGLIRLYSEPGHGTTIKIYLPSSTEPATVGATLATAPATATPAGSAPTHVLVVEDNPALAEVIQRLLRPGGYTVTVALSPTAALAALDGGNPVDLVVTDVVMPELTGPELARRVHDRHPGLPIVYTSGYTSGVLGERAHLDPDAILVEKPFTRSSLLTAVARALGR